MWKKEQYQQHKNWGMTAGPTLIWWWCKTEPSRLRVVSVNAQITVKVQHNSNSSLLPRRGSSCTLYLILRSHWNWTPPFGTFYQKFNLHVAIFTFWSLTPSSWGLNIINMMSRCLCLKTVFTRPNGKVELLAIEDDFFRYPTEEECQRLPTESGLKSYVRFVSICKQPVSLYL